MHFFDKLEDKIRNLLSRLPILYALVGGVGIILFWRGVWHTADFISYYFLAWGNGGNPTIDLVSAYDGPISFVLGFLMLLSTGLWVSNFIGAEIITEAGIVGILANNPSPEFLALLKSKLDISIDKHHSQGILVNGHQECAGNPYGT